MSIEHVAHRGYAAVEPENTIGAFRAAAETADWIELDVRRCGSGELAVVHDETLGRVADSELRVACAARDELAACDVLGSGEGVPMLTEALEAIPEDVGVQIELKETGTATDAASAVEATGNEACLISFDPRALLEADRNAPEIPRGYVLHPELFGDTPELGIDTAVKLGCQAVHLYHSMASVPGTVEYAAENGLAVQSTLPESMSWPEGVGDALAKLETLGVDRVSTDRPLGQ